MCLPIKPPEAQGTYVPTESREKFLSKYFFLLLPHLLTPKTCSQDEGLLISQLSEFIAFLHPQLVLTLFVGFLFLFLLASCKFLVPITQEKEKQQKTF